MIVKQKIKIFCLYQFHISLYQIDMKKRESSDQA